MCVRQGVEMLVRARISARFDEMYEEACIVGCRIRQDYPYVKTFMDYLEAVEMDRKDQEDQEDEYAFLYDSPNASPTYLPIPYFSDNDDYGGGAGDYSSENEFDRYIIENLLDSGDKEKKKKKKKDNKRKREIDDEETEKKKTVGRPAIFSAPKGYTPHEKKGSNYRVKCISCQEIVDKRTALNNRHTCV